MWCGRNRRACANCGDCGDKPMYKRLHLDRYHHYETVTGLGLVWRRGDCGDTRALDRAMKAAGFEYEIYDRSHGRAEVFAALAGSVDRGLPALLKLGGGEDWHIVSGVESADNSLHGVDANGHYCMTPSVVPDAYDGEGRFSLVDWFEPMTCAVVITGRREPLALSDLLADMAETLLSNGGEALERDVVKAIEGAEALDSVGRQSLAEWFNDLAGYTVECRWHAAEAATADLLQMTDSAEVREKLGEITDQYLLFHDLCWKIWGLLGVGPESNYQIAGDASERLTRPEVKAELISLFRKLFEIDRNVLALLKGCVAALKGEKG